jgi:molybdopterin synthase catalytic subunit
MTTSPEQKQEKESLEGKRLRVSVLFFGAAREAVGSSTVELEIDAPADTRGAFAEVMTRFPVLQERFGRSLLFAVNQEYAAPEAPVQDGDELAVFPPVSGGAGETVADETQEGAFAAEDFFELTIEPIDVGSVARRIVPRESGATVTLDGYVREWTRNRRTLYLVYEAYAPMALNEMRRLGRVARERFDISHIGIVHRTGRLEIGETSVVISVSAPHRRAAFEACEWAIRELKRTVPIWKKEFYADGEVWVEGEGAPENLLRHT